MVYLRLTSLSELREDDDDTRLRKFSESPNGGNESDEEELRISCDSISGENDAVLCFFVRPDGPE